MEHRMGLSCPPVSVFRRKPMTPLEMDLILTVWYSLLPTPDLENSPVGGASWGRWTSAPVPDPST